MAYTKQTWADLPSKTTPINATRLGHIEDGIFNAAATADNAASAAGTAAANVGIVSGKVETLTERVNGLDTAVSNKVDKVADKGLSTNDYDDTDKGKVDSLGTASTKNSISVVTESSDLVESGGVLDTLRDAEVVEGKNLLIYPYDAQTAAYAWGTVTVNSDGSITVNGTTTERTAIKLETPAINYNLPNGNYILSLENVQSGASLLLEGYNGVTWAKLIGTANVGNPSVSISIDHNGYTNLSVYISIESGTALNNVRFKPMIRKASETDPTYEPYYIPLKDALPNKCDNSVIGIVEDGTTASQAYAVREHFIRDGQFKEVTQPIASGGAINDSNTVDKPIADCLVRLLPIFNNAGFHNGIFRGKNLGSSVTTAQRNAITAGTFEDMYIGDYWEINSVKYRIAHFDYWLNCGDTGGVGICTSHHVVVVPDSALVDKRMNAKVNNMDTTAGAYVNSEMRTTNLADAKTIVNTAFGADNILTHREYMQNAVTDGYESGGAWVNADIELMSEIMVYGSNIFHNVKCGTALPSLYTVNKTQFALFRLDPSFIVCKDVAQTDRSNWWLRDVVSATTFAYVTNAGIDNYDGASNGFGVRPAFGIK